MATSRASRDLARGRRAAARIRRHGCSAMAAACAHMEATFSPAIRHSILKDRISTVMQRGTRYHQVRTRYGRLVERHPVTNVDAAIVLVDRLRRAECQARALAIANSGRYSRSRLGLMLLDEVRLILRMLRRYAPGRFAHLVAEIRWRRSKPPACQ
jgi:hypothetical protein